MGGAQAWLCVNAWKGTQGNSMEIKGTQGNSRELKGTLGFSKEALVEVMEGKKLRKRGKEGKFHKCKEEKRENIEALYERLTIHTVYTKYANCFAHNLRKWTCTFATSFEVQRFCKKKQNLHVSVAKQLVSKWGKLNQNDQFSRLLRTKTFCLSEFYQLIFHASSTFLMWVLPHFENTFLILREMIFYDQ